MENISEHCSPLVEKLSRIAKSQCNSSLDQMMSNWLCFEICCALEKAIELKTEVNIWSDISPDIKDKLGLPQIDVGIDYMDTACSFAGQAKLYQEGGYVTAHDIDRTRLCAYRAKKHTNDKEIMKHNCEIATPEGIRLGKSKIEMDDIAHKVISKERIVYWYNLALGLKSNISRKENNIEPELRNCQREAIFNIQKERINRIRLACGSGKTRVAKEIIMKEKGQYLILVPYLTLLEQWDDYLGSFDVDVIKIGTGHTGQKRGKLPKDKITIIICVYDSYKEAFEYEDESGKSYERKFKWVVVDEAHHIEGKTEGRNGEIYGKIKTQKSVLLLSASLKKKRDGVGLHYNYSLRDAINDKICCDYDLKFCFFDVEPSMKTIAKYINEHSEYSSILAYCNTIDSAKKLANICNKIGVSAKSLSCEDKKKIRKETLLSFDNGEFRVLTSVNTLGEGINLVNVDTCLFAESRSSEISVTQCVGRVVRKTKGKKLAHVVVCTNYESERNPIIRIMKYLLNDDELLFKISKRRIGSNRINIEHQNADTEANEELIEKMLYGDKRVEYEYSYEVEDDENQKNEEKNFKKPERSITRLEAHWAYIFTRLGWKWKYKEDEQNGITFFFVTVLKRKFIVLIIDSEIETRKYLNEYFPRSLYKDEFYIILESSIYPFALGGCLVGSVWNWKWYSKKAEIGNFEYIDVCVIRKEKGKAGYFWVFGEASAIDITNGYNSNNLNSNNSGITDLEGYWLEARECGYIKK